MGLRVRCTWWQRITLGLTLFASCVQGLAAPAAAQPIASPAAQQATATPGPCLRGTLPHGALSLICVPTSGWNGDLVVFAHGYTAFNEPLGFQNLTLTDGTYLPDMTQGLGFAFATTSYRQNGLAILEGVDDIRELVAAFRATAPRPPAHTYLTGASEGGLVSALLAERSPDLFSGVLSLCGPIGDFRRQINYFGDFRVLFDYFFPGVLPGSPIDIPQELMDNWSTVYVPRIYNALVANPSAALQLISTAHASVDAGNLGGTTVETTLEVLWYNVFATNDAKAKLGGNPFGNLKTRYSGSANDDLLNARVERFAPSPKALLSLARYQTSGTLAVPMVTLHTTGDDVIPFWHEILYNAKVHATGRGSFTPIPVFRYGHCTFTTPEVLSAFVLTVYQAVGQQIPGAPTRPNVDQTRRDFERAQRESESRSDPISGSK